MFILRVITALNQYKVPYALVGGYAVALHGAQRGTYDVDIVIRLSASSLNAVEKAMKSIGLSPRQPITAVDLSKNLKRYRKERNLKAWSFVNRDNAIELVDVVIAEDLKGKTVVRKNILGVDINVLSKKNLIAMKRIAGRPQDLADIRALEGL